MTRRHPNVETISIHKTITHKTVIVQHCAWCLLLLRPATPAAMLLPTAAPAAPATTAAPALLPQPPPPPSLLLSPGPIQLRCCPAASHPHSPHPATHPSTYPIHPPKQLPTHPGWADHPTRLLSLAPTSSSLPPAPTPAVPCPAASSAGSPMTTMALSAPHSE